MYDRNGRYVNEELIKAYRKWRFERLDRNIMSNKKTKGIMIQIQFKKQLQNII